jgi:hypothetical protein
MKCILLYLSLQILVSTSIASSVWTVPLYLWRSGHHTALLPNEPSTYSNVMTNFTKVISDSIAYAQVVPENGVSYPLVTLKVYYSAERSDIQTTTWSLSQLNAHGGNYIYISTIGAIASTPGSGYDASSFVPLTVSYNKAYTDAATAPLSANDLNMLLNTSDTENYRTGGVITGFARKSSCGNLCSVSMSETFPSSGGADCAYECKHTERNFDTTYELGKIDSMASNILKENMEKADEIILQFGKRDVTVTPRSRGTHIHMSFNYFCCYSDEDIITMHTVLETFDWPTVNINFDQPTIRIDGDSEDVNHYSFIILLDEESQIIMHQIISDVEDAMRSAGLDIHVPRKQQEPFHSTLAVVDGKDFPVIAALKAVNTAIPPKTWTAGNSITLDKPTWN